MPPPSASMREFPTHTNTAFSLPWHYPTMGHWVFEGTRSSLPINVWQGYCLLHMQLEPWVPPCVLFDWWFSSCELWGIWLVDIVVLPIVANPFSSINHFSNSSIGDPMLIPKGCCKHLSLYSSVSGRASEETAVAGSCHQTLLAIFDSVWVWCLYMEWIPRWEFSGWPLLQSQFHSLSPHFLLWLFCSPFYDIFFCYSKWICKLLF